MGPKTGHGSPRSEILATPLHVLWRPRAPFRWAGLRLLLPLPWASPCWQRLLLPQPSAARHRIPSQRQPSSQASPDPIHKPTVSPKPTCQPSRLSRLLLPCTGACAAVSLITCRRVPCPSAGGHIPWHAAASLDTAVTPDRSAALPGKNRPRHSKPVICNPVGEPAAPRVFPGSRRGGASAERPADPGSEVRLSAAAELNQKRGPSLSWAFQPMHEYVELWCLLQEAYG